VALRGLEPLTPCLQTAGCASTRVHPRRSRPRCVSGSIQIRVCWVLSCCTHQLDPRQPGAQTALQCAARESPVRPMMGSGLDPWNTTVATEPGTRHTPSRLREPSTAGRPPVTRRGRAFFRFHRPFGGDFAVEVTATSLQRQWHLRFPCEGGAKAGWLLRSSGLLLVPSRTSAVT
jgi:hypothetical protein